MSQLRINRGTTFNIGVVFKKDGVAASLVGATIRFTIKSHEYDADMVDSTALVAKNVTSHTNAAAGLSTIPILPTDTDDIVPGKYFFDIKVKEASGDIHTLLKGRCWITGSPTNRQA